MPSIARSSNTNNYSFILRYMGALAVGAVVAMSFAIAISPCEATVCGATAATMSTGAIISTASLIPSILLALATIATLAITLALVVGLCSSRDPVSSAYIASDLGRRPVYGYHFGYTNCFPSFFGYDWNRGNYHQHDHRRHSLPHTYRSHQHGDVGVDGVRNHHHTERSSRSAGHDHATHRHGHR